jgi:ketosteroid isomerase-like protein
MINETVDTTIAELRDRLAIEAVFARYVRGVDRKDFDLLRSAYHDDAEDFHGAYNGDVDGLIEWGRTRHETVEQSMHFIGKPIVELDGDRAFGETYAIVMQRVAGDPPRRITIGCRYVDRFERRDGEWRIAKHVVAYEFWREEPCEGEMEFGPEWTVAQRSRDDAVYRIRDEVPA